MKQHIRFKALEIGARFSHAGANYRKIAGRKAFKMLPNFRGDTSKKITFCRNTFVEATP